MSHPNIDANREQQTTLYGAPLGDIAQRVMDALDLSQRGLAQVLGLSAPMLSQLMSGQRIKISNPTVVARLKELMLLQEQAAGLDADQLKQQLDWISRAQVTLTDTAVSRSPEADERALVEALAALGDQAGLQAAAGALAQDHPLARVLLSAARMLEHARG